MLKIYYSALNYLSSESVLKTLKNRDKSKKHIIITPDRASLKYEKQLFSVTGESSFFDVSITTLSRFCNNIIKKHHQEKKVLSKMSGVAIVKKILIEHQSSLKAFNRNVKFKNFANDVYNILCMFKSNNSKPIDVVNKATSNILKDKLSDLNFVYEKYEEFLQTSFTDSFNRLNLCKELINKDDFKDVNIYFLDFDDFTKQGYSIIEKLIKCANNVVVATTFAKKEGEKNNSNIYLNNVFYNVIDLAKTNGIEYDLVFVPYNADEEMMHLCNNVFGFKTQNYGKKSTKIQVDKYLNFNQEIKSVLSQIKLAVINGAKYKNFAILVPSLSQNRKAIEDQCVEFDVPYFFDESEKLNENFISKYIINLLKLQIKITKESVFNILKSPFYDGSLEEVFEFENFVKKYGLVDKALLNPNNEVIKSFLKPYSDFSSIKNEKTVEDYLNKLLKFLSDTNFEQKLENVSGRYFKNNQILEYKRIENIKIKLNTVFEELKTVLADTKCNAKLFLEIFESCLESLTIAIPPILSDCVFVGDIASSYIEKCDNVFILGANEGSLPCYTSDDGIITDDEIDLMDENKKLSPSVKFVNKKSKFKVFESLFLANKKLNISYHTKNGSADCYPSAFLIDICKFMNIETKDYNLAFNEIENNLVSINENNILFNNFNKKTAVINLLKNMKLFEAYKNNKNFITLISTIKETVNENELIDNFTYKNSFENLQEHNFFKNSTCGTSEFEKFFRCPYMHFVDYGLKLKEFESDEVKAYEIGNIIHEFLKFAVPVLTENVKTDIDGLVENTLDKILNSNNYNHIILNNNNKFLVKELKNECKRVCGVVLNVNKHSLFVPKYYEKPFNNNNIFDIKINNKKLSLVGVIDRIDEYGDNSIVIDYKTGSSSFSDFTDVFYGKKLQLIVYIMALSDNNLKFPVGAFYMPILNGYSKNEDNELYKLKGIINTQIANFTDFDGRLSSANFNSDIINIGTDKNGNIKTGNNFYKNLCLNNDEFDMLKDYVKKLLNEGANKIVGGTIIAQPLSSGNRTECEYCKYKTLCNFNKLCFNNCVEMDKKSNIYDITKKEKDERD